MLENVCEHGFLRRSCSICDLEEENQLLLNALREIVNPSIEKWFEFKEMHGGEISFQVYLQSIAEEVLKKV
jgi:hypothetical protein